MEAARQAIAIQAIGALDLRATRRGRIKPMKMMPSGDMARVQPDDTLVNAACLQQQVEQRIGQPHGDVGAEYQRNGTQSHCALAIADVRLDWSWSFRAIWTVGGMEDRIELTLPPVFNPNNVPRSYNRLNST